MKSFITLRPGCFTLCCGGLCFVSPPLGAMGWSGVCDCGISWSYSLAFYVFISSSLNFLLS